MESTSRLDSLTDRTIFYYRQRSKNRLFEAITAFFAEEAERRGITKRDIAECLRRDPAQITRWLTNPSNLTADTISDLLLSLGAEMDYQIVRFEDRPQPNERHSLMSAVTVPRVSKKQISTSAKFEELTTAQTSAPPTPSIEFHQL